MYVVNSNSFQRKNNKYNITYTHCNLAVDNCCKWLK